MDLAQHPLLRDLLGYAPPFHSRLLPSRTATYIGWGRKWSGKRAVDIASARGAGFQLVEDGFLRSVGRLDPALSMVFDDKGIYYDGTSPSRLEDLIGVPLDDAQRDCARAVMRLWREQNLSKYNAEREYQGTLPEHYVLVVDQVASDASVGYGRADRGSFDRMLCRALAENPDATIVVKMHPDAFIRDRAGHFDVKALGDTDRVRVIAENCHPVRLIENATAVYTVTSQIGFEALIYQKPVRCFGMPFYAGWGLTDDDMPPPDRRGTATLEQLVHAALIRYPRYVDPERREECDVELVMNHVGLQRRMMGRYPAQVFADGFSRWKKPILKRFLSGSTVTFIKTPRDVPPDATVVAWGMTPLRDLADGVTVLRVEDGFLRSSGLGADLIRPMSWVLDDVGLYYDASAPSRLEHLLQAAEFSTETLDRARALRHRIEALGVTKYNLPGQHWRRPTSAARVILVPGQVEGDASLRLGAPGIRTDRDLLAAVRKENPDAYILYKPHPDVVAGLRSRGDDPGTDTLCDEILTTGDMAQFFPQIDEVHTMTSLAGFEALLRGLPVTCYGQPFYAGWGLTRDVIPCTRRSRTLDIDALVAGALIEYPTYISRISGTFTTPERALEELADWRDSGSARRPFWRRGLRGALQLWAASGLKGNE